MKNLILLISFVLTGTLTGAQVVQETRDMSLGAQPALTLVIPGADVKFVSNEWKDFTKNYGKLSKVSHGKEYVIANTHILDIGGANNINLYALAEDVNGGTKVVVWIQMEGQFIDASDSPKEYKSAVEFMEEFEHKVDVDMIALDLDAQQKALAKFEDNMAKLQHDNDALQKTIDDAKKKIADAEASITANLEAQETAQKEIDDQKALVDAVQKKLVDAKSRKSN
jgi:hypothetical protein